MDLFRNWTQRRHSRRQRVLVLVLSGPFVVVAASYLLIDAGLCLGDRLGWQRVPLGVLGPIPGADADSARAGTGGLVALCPVHSRWGTPVPALPTKKLIVVRPFSYCRNPMSLGTLIAYAGLALLVGSPGGLLMMMGVAILLLAYIKLIEERELEARFGPEYVEYKRTTPFLIPRLPGTPGGSGTGAGYGESNEGAD